MHIPWNLLRRFAKGQLLESELTDLEQWRQSSELNQLIFDEIVSDENFVKQLEAGQWDDNSKHWDAVLAKLTPAEPKIIFNRQRFYQISAIAASLLILIGLSIAWLYSSWKNRGFSEDNFTYIYSPRGQRTQVILPDSTKVWLNSETSIRYPVSFNKKAREVTIEGEAFFKVTKNAKKPFYVKTSDLRVKVYGTSFNVKAYPNEKYIETTLIEGKLSVIPNSKPDAPENEIFLKPKDKLKFPKPGIIEADSVTTAIKKSLAQKKQDKKDMPKMLLSRNINSDPENLWKDGKLIFMDEKFGDMAIKLERWYDVKIHFENEKIKNFRFTGKIDKETINQAMEALKISSQNSYRYEIVFRDIYLK